MTEVLTIIAGIFKFWDQVTWLVKLLQSTPEQDHEKLVSSIQAEAANVQKTGRPTWT